MMSTLKTALIGLWGVMVALGAAYMTATWDNGATAETVRSEHEPAGLEFRRPGAITVPMIADGKLRGYVVAKVVFTADAQAIRHFPIDPQPFVLDEAFRNIYTDGRIEFDHMSKYNLDDITAKIKTAVNARLGAELIDDILIDELNFVDKETLDKGAQKASASRETASQETARHH